MGRGSRCGTDIGMSFCMGSWPRCGMGVGVRVRILFRIGSGLGTHGFEMGVGAKTARTSTSSTRLGGLTEVFGGHNGTTENLK